MKEIRYQYEGSAIRASEKVRADASSVFLAKVFYWMAIGLGLTAVTAFLVANTSIKQLVFGNSMVFYLLMFGELGLVFYLSARINAMPASRATGIFVIYSILNGVTLSAILLMYSAPSVASTFFITGGMFATMAVYGTVTKKDLSSMGSFLFMGLIGMIIAGVVNIFLHSSMVSWVISAVGVLVFTGLTAYDVQKITHMGAAGIMNEGDAAIRKGAIIGALALYLDFINLFLSLLYLLGGRRD